LNWDKFPDESVECQRFCFTIWRMTVGINFAYFSSLSLGYQRMIIY
jgi:hypothetical protein